MADPFPHYDVLDKHDTQSWNDKSREVIDARLALTEDNKVLAPAQMATLRRLVACVTPQPEQRAPTNTLAILIQKIGADAGDGFRPAGLPPVRDCWQRGLDAIDSEAREHYDTPFAALDDEAADALLRRIEANDVRAEAWRALPPSLFWYWRVLPDLISAHWAHPSLWSAMGFGGPAAPRGYVRLDADRRDEWEAREERRD